MSSLNIIVYVIWEAAGRHLGEIMKSFGSLHDNDVCWSSMNIIMHVVITEHHIYDNDVCWSSMNIIMYVVIIEHHHVCHLGGSWEASGKHLGEIMKSFGSLLGSIWRQLGGRRLKRHLEVRSHIMCLTLERNAKAALKCQFHEEVLMVPSIMTAYLQSDMSGGFSPDLSDRSRALYQHRENPISWS